MFIYHADELRCSIVIANKFIRSIIERSIAKRPLEACGILVGYYSKDLTTAIVTEVLHSEDETATLVSTKFDPSLQKQLNDIWDKTDGNRYMVGDWHSHPNGSPEPSKKDDDAIFKGVNEQHPENMSLIIGRNLTENDIQIHIYKKPDIKIKMVRDNG